MTGRLTGVGGSAVAGGEPVAVLPKLKSGKCNVKAAPTDFSWVKAFGKVSFQ